MASGVNAHVGTDEAVVTDGDIGFVEHSEVEIGEKPLPHTDMLPVVTEERLYDENLVIAHLADEVFQHFKPAGGVARAQGIIVVNDFLGGIEFYKQFWVDSRVVFPR